MIVSTIQSISHRLQLTGLAVLLALTTPHQVLADPEQLVNGASSSEHTAITSATALTNYLVSNPTAMQYAEVATSHSKDTSLRLENIASYFEVVAYYQSALTTLNDWFPGVGFEYRGIFVLEPYFGSRAMSHFTPASNPKLLLHTPALEAPEMTYRRIAVTIKDKTIPGLEVRTYLHPFYIQKFPRPIYDLLYISTINARVFGFTHGQVILPLSKNVEPGPEFEYNGPRKWKHHKRYQRNDQVEKAIPLTNHAHSSSGDYLVSDHPDFALAFKEFANHEVVVTFYLWHTIALPGLQKSKMLDSPPLPDFIFQYRVVPSIEDKS